MQPWQGQSQHDFTANDALNIPPNHPFHLMHHPLSWEHIAGEGEKTGEWLPTFASLKEDPGVNGVRQTQFGPDSSQARLNFQDNGYTIIDYGSHEYLTRHLTRSGGYYYCLIWSSPKQVANKVFWALDNEKFNQFRRELIEKGVIDKPEPEILELLCDRWRRRIERHARNQHIPEIKEKMNILYGELDGMRKSKNEMFKKKGKK